MLSNSNFSIIAVEKGNDIMVGLLLSRSDTNLNLVNKNGETPLTIALQMSAKQIVMRLVTSYRLKMDLPQHKNLLKICWSH